MIRIIKYALMMITIITLFTYKVDYIYASNGDCVYTINGVPVGDGYTSGNGYGGSYGESTSGGTCSVGTHTYCNVHDAAAEEHITLEEDVYDSKKEPIGKALLIKGVYKLVAGRFVGIDAYEDYKKTFYVSMNPICVKGVEVTYYYTVCCTCNGEESCHTESATRIECSSCAPDMGQCYGEQENRLNELIGTVDPTPSYEAYRQDVNDINAGINNNEPTIEVPLSDMNKKISATQRNGNTASKSITYTYTYNLTQDWIDPYTGLVKYDAPEQELKDKLQKEFGSMFGIERFSTELTADDRLSHIKVDEQTVTRNNPIHVGHYFIPLNATSKDRMRYYIVPKVDLVNHPDKKRSIHLCESLIDKYNVDSPNREYWADFITDPDGHKFNRDTPAETAKRIIENGNGCYLSIYAEFEIEQGFYDEVKPGNLNGYNFYYRPIDNGKPFPNGLSKNSFWADLYEYDGKRNTIPYTYLDNSNSLQKVTRYLDNSYNEVTYETNEDYDVHKVREYNEKGDATISQNSIHNNTYTTWSTLNLSGVSNFINSKYGIIRTNDCDTFYALGCGPSNANWEECKARQSKVCDSE